MANVIEQTRSICSTPGYIVDMVATNICVLCLLHQMRIRIKPVISLLHLAIGGAPSKDSGVRFFSVFRIHDIYGVDPDPRIHASD
jgi:hypothetical protein